MLNLELKMLLLTQNRHFNRTNVILQRHNSTIHYCIMHILCTQKKPWLPRDGRRSVHGRCAMCMCGVAAGDAVRRRHGWAGRREQRRKTRSHHAGTRATGRDDASRTETNSTNAARPSAERAAACSRELRRALLSSVPHAEAKAKFKLLYTF